MKHHFIFMRSFIAIISLVIVAIACDDPGLNDPHYQSSTTIALMKITDKSPSVNSFTPNYNEEEAMAFSGSLAKDFYPVRIGQKLNMVERNLTLQTDSTTATGTLVQKYEGELIIAGSFQKPTMGINSKVDTIINKPFTTIITRLIKYERVSNTGNDTVDWKITAISLPYGGTAGEDIIIQSLKLEARDGSTIVVDDPNAYFFNVGKDKSSVNDDDEDDSNHIGVNFGAGWHEWKKLFTWYKKHQTVKLTVEVLSTSNDPDLLTITYGAMMKGGGYKSKVKFDFVSSTQEGALYRKVYETNWKLHSHSGRMHAVINALPRSIVYDSETSVQIKTWGLPYKVQ